MFAKMGITIALIFHVSCGQPEEETSEIKSQLGHTCYSVPFLEHESVQLDGQPVNVCKQPGKSFHGGALGLIMARSEAVAACESMNALDFGYLAGEGKSCFAQCEIETSCVPFTNN